MQRFLVLPLLALAFDGYAMELIAHRGYACMAPENSVNAVRHAWQAGADAVELDVRVSRDGEVYIYHDDKIAGASASKLNHAEVRKFTGATHAPLLAEILMQGEPPGYFILDLKKPGPADLPKIVEAVTNSGIDEDKFAFQSDRLKILGALRQRLPDSRYFFLSKLRRSPPLFRTPSASRLLRRIDGHRIARLSLKQRPFIDRAFIEELHRSGYRVNVWTVNDPVRARHYASIGADGLITDQVEQVQRELGLRATGAGGCRP